MSACGTSRSLHKNGRKLSEETWKDGKLVTIVIWQINGERCPVTNVVNGNGVVGLYKEDGTEFGHVTYKDGVRD